MTQCGTGRRSSTRNQRPTFVNRHLEHNVTFFVTLMRPLLGGNGRGACRAAQEAARTKLTIAGQYLCAGISL